MEEITEALTNELQNAEAMAAQETKLREEAEAEIKMQENAAEAWQKQFQESETAKQALKKKLKKNSSSHEELKKVQHMLYTCIFITHVLYLYENTFVNCSLSGFLCFYSTFFTLKKKHTSTWSNVI